MSNLKRATAIFCLFFVANGLQAQEPSNGKEFSSLYNAVKAEPNPVKMEIIMARMEALPEAGDREKHLVDYCRQLTADAFAQSGNIEKAKSWIGRVEDKATKASAIYSVVEILTEKNKLKEAGEILAPALNKEGQSAAEAMATANPFSGSGPTAIDFGYEYGVILLKKGEHKKSLSYLEAAVNNENRARRTGRMETYAIALANAGESDKAYEVMNKLITSPGHRTEAFQNAAQNLFKQKDGNDSRYRQLTDSMAVVEKKKLESKIAAMQVTETAPDLTLTDLNGKTVSLKNLRGKTVILDFWATWCQPCVGSFPGMQKAVDYYKNDSSVVFMFIHTFERSDNATEEARQFMEYKKYRFNVYMDLKGADGSRNKAASDYNVRAIPTKFVIDKNGNIRF